MSSVAQAHRWQRTHKYQGLRAPISDGELDEARVQNPPVSLKHFNTGHRKRSSHPPFVAGEV